MPLVGPGSEWFWSAFSGIILAVTVVALYRQLRLQANTSAIDQLTAFEAEWLGERLSRYKLDVVRELHRGTPAVSLSDGPTWPLFNFWERIGSLAKAGHLDVGLLVTVNLGVCPLWWATLQPWVVARRAEFGPTFAENWEWLATKVEQANERIGVPTMSSLGDLGAFIAELEYRIGVEVALRSGDSSPDGPASGARASARGRPSTR